MIDEFVTVSECSSDSNFSFFKEDFGFFDIFFLGMLDFLDWFSFGVFSKDLGLLF